MRIKVFIENEAGSDLKHLYDEKTLEFNKTITVSRKYPYPYGFILNTTSGDGDNLDCFVLTKQVLKTGQTIECEPIGMVEQFENGKEDHNIIATMSNEDVQITEEVKEKLTEFIKHVFDHRPNKIVTVGNFLDKDMATQLIEKSTNKLAILNNGGERTPTPPH